MKKIISIYIFILYFVFVQNTAFSQDIKEIDFGPYMKNLQKIIKANWHPVEESEGKKVVVLFKINKNGALGKIKIYKSSGNEAFDKQASSVISHSSPFPPLPKEFVGNSIDVQFTFDRKKSCDKCYEVNNLKLISNNEAIDKVYIDKLSKEVQSNWVMPVEKYGKKAVVIGYLNKDGTIETAIIINKSGDERFDKNALIAVNKSFPFEPFPENIKDNPLIIKFYFSQDLDIYFEPYMQTLEKKIKSNWDFPYCRVNKKIGVVLKVNKDGTLEKSEIYESSGNDILDKKALEAVSKSAPFPPLPQEFHGKSFDFLFYFDYRVYE